MGLFSELALELYGEVRERTYPTRRETLQYFLEDLEDRLATLLERGLFDDSIPSESFVHYYENPTSMQNILFCIEEVKALLRTAEEEERTGIEAVKRPPCPIIRIGENAEQMHIAV